MKFNNFLSEFIHIINGIGQGDPLSMVLYTIYNADLLELVLSPDKEALGFVDNILAMVEGRTLEENFNTLVDFMKREDGGFTWSEKHGSNYALDKLAVTCFSRKRIPDPHKKGKTILEPAPDSVLRGKMVQVECSYRYLGIYVDSQLKWVTQTHEATAKMTKWILLYR
jgi:hypothetical protein